MMVLSANDWQPNKDAVLMWSPFCTYACCYYFTLYRGAEYCEQHVCLSDCLSACISQKSCDRTSQNLLYMLPVAVVRCCSNNTAIC